MAGPLAAVQLPDGGVSPGPLPRGAVGGAVSLVVNAILLRVDPILMGAGLTCPRPRRLAARR
jgi:hypothetical protein